MNVKTINYIEDQFCVNGEREGYRDGFVDGMIWARLELEQARQSACNYIAEWLPLTIDNVGE